MRFSIFWSVAASSMIRIVIDNVVSSPELVSLDYNICELMPDELIMTDRSPSTVP